MGKKEKEKVTLKMLRGSSKKNLETIENMRDKVNNLYNEYPEEFQEAKDRMETFYNDVMDKSKFDGLFLTKKQLKSLKTLDPCEYSQIKYVYKVNFKLLKVASNSIVHINEDKFRERVVVAVFKDGKVLLRNKENTKSFVGGGVEKGIGLEQQAVNELAEEMNMKIDNLRLVKATIVYDSKKKNGIKYDGTMDYVFIADFVKYLKPSDSEYRMNKVLDSNFKSLTMSEFMDVEKILESDYKDLYEDIVFFKEGIYAKLPSRVESEDIKMETDSSNDIESLGECGSEFDNIHSFSDTNSYESEPLEYDDNIPHTHIESSEQRHNRITKVVDSVLIDKDKEKLKVFKTVKEFLFSKPIKENFKYIANRDDINIIFKTSDVKDKDILLNIRIDVFDRTVARCLFIEDKLSIIGNLIDDKANTIFSLTMKENDDDFVDIAFDSDANCKGIIEWLDKQLKYMESLPMDDNGIVYFKYKETNNSGDEVEFHNNLDDRGFLKIKEFLKLFKEDIDGKDNVNFKFKIKGDKKHIMTLNKIEEGYTVMMMIENDKSSKEINYESVFYITISHDMENVIRGSYRKTKLDIIPRIVGELRSFKKEVKKNNVNYSNK